MSRPRSRCCGRYLPREKQWYLCTCNCVTAFCCPPLAILFVPVGAKSVRLRQEAIIRSSTSVAIRGAHEGSRPFLARTPDLYVTAQRTYYTTLHNA